MERTIIEHDLKMAFDDGYQAGMEAAQPKWISVEERLPEETGQMLICIFGQVMCVKHTGNGKIITADLDTWNLRDKYITHWMPLPPAPREA